MSTSRDVQTLFERFGGDANGYQEIRTENEAQEARERWPLLGMTDPRKVELHSSGTPRSSALSDPSTVREEDGVARAAPDRSQAALRRSAALFMQSPRRDIPPVIEPRRRATPESAAFRFSPAPINDEASKHADATPAREEGSTALREPAQDPAQDRAQAPGSPGPLAATPASAQAAPLKKLFGASQPVAQTAQPQSLAVKDGPERLETLFDRLRKGDQDAKRSGEAGRVAPARPWFLGRASQR